MQIRPLVLKPIRSGCHIDSLMIVVLDPSSTPDARQ